MDDRLRTVVHMDLDAFFVSVSRLINPKLIDQPVIVGGGDRGVVAACSYETRVFGVHSAMPIKLAKRLCPQAVIIRGDYDEYSKRSDEVTQIIGESVPVYERSSIDEFYMDLSGMDQFFGCYKYAVELREKIMKETGLPISFGMSKNKTVSKIATDYIKPNNYKMVEFGTEKSFLAPLSVQRIPMIGEKTYMLLRSMGIEKVYTLQQMPAELLQNVLGDNGLMIWKKANGIDNSPVEPYSEQKSISTEETFVQDTIDVERMKNILVAMTEKLCFRLRSENRLTSCITVKVRYSNFDTHTMQCRIPYTCSDHTLITSVKKLFDKLYNRRMLIRLIGVRMSHLVGGGHQINMFEDSEAILNLYYMMDKVRLLYGEDKIKRAAGCEYSLRSFNPFNGVSSSPSAANENTTEGDLPSLKSIGKLFNLKAAGNKLLHDAETDSVQVYEYLLLPDLPAAIRNEVRELQDLLEKETGVAIRPRNGAYATLLHFLLSETEEERIINAISSVASLCEPFEIQLKNFRFAKTQTIYIDAFSQAFGGLLRGLRLATSLPASRTHYAWKPRLHLTTKMNEHVFSKTKQVLKGRTFESSFIAGSLSLLRHHAAFGQYETAAEFGLGR